MFCPTNTQPPSCPFSCGLSGCTYLAHFKLLSVSTHNDLPGSPAWTAISLTTNNGQTTCYLNTSGIFLWGVGFLIPCCMPEAPAASALSNSSGVCISRAPGGKLSILQEPVQVFKEERVRNHRKDEKKSLGNNWGNKRLLQFSGPQSVKSNISFSQTIS